MKSLRNSFLLRRSADKDVFTKCSDIFITKSAMEGECVGQFNEEHEIATKRLSDLMQEYLAIKKVERNVGFSKIFFFRNLMFNIYRISMTCIPRFSNEYML